MQTTKSTLILLTGLASFPAMSQSRVGSRPNIIVILADDIGYGDLSCYGATALKMSHTDQLAAKGLKFTHAYACASTSTPSRYGLLTGSYPWRRNDTGIARGDAPMIIHPGQTTIASQLQEAGYTTAAIGKWHLGLGEGGFNCQAWNDSVTPGPRQIGFDYSYIMAATGDRVPCVYLENQKISGLDPKDPIQVDYNRPIAGEPTAADHPEMLTMQSSHGHNQAIVNGIGRIGYMKGGSKARWVDENIADTLAEKAVNFIRKNNNRPFFLYFCTQDIHVPRVPHHRFKGTTTMGPRGDALMEFDWTVSCITQTIADLHLEEKTVIIVTSDNGPVVDDGYQDQAVEKLGNHTPGGKLRGGKYSIFEAGTRIPFFISWPGIITPGVSDAVVSHIDFLATLSSLAGHPLSDDKSWDSLDQLDTWLGKSRNGRPFVIEQSGKTLAWIEDLVKYIEPSDGSTFDHFTHTELGNSTEPQLYYLKSDEGEKVNQASNHLKQTENLRLKLDNLKKKK
ncbi:MAG: sulfatase-like hydrolase/transferase [Marinilabiliales bacterium]|nr:sulfatase-like hydrolase/transferase [Marinilabiliales bacterium]